MIIFLRKNKSLQVHFGNNFSIDMSSIESVTKTGKQTSTSDNLKEEERKELANMECLSKYHNLKKKNSSFKF